METLVAGFTTARKVRFGADALTSEGERGTVNEMVVDPTTGAAIGVGIRFGMFARLVYAGFERLTQGTDEVITLDAPRSALSATPPAGARLTPATLVTLDGKRAGRLAHITFDSASRTPLRIVIDRSMGSMSVSARGLTKVDAGTLALSSERDGAGLTLTPYHPDDALRADIRQALERYPRMWVDISGIDIQVIDGVVWLRGHVSSEINRRLVEDLSGGVEGVAELHNLLLPDPELAARISRALALDPITAEERIGVYPALGRVHLRGFVRTAAAREAAARIAAADQGALEVFNELRIDPRATVLPTLAGVTGQEDIVPGGR